MSKSDVDQDGFQIVKTKRISKNKQTKLPAKAEKFEKDDIDIDVDKALVRIQSAVDDLRTSKYFEDLSRAVSTTLQNRNISEIVCLGLGHIGECHISSHQLALLLCLRDLCNPSKVLVHDPIFYKSECYVLKQLGLHVILENNEGSYVISDEEITLVYLPHCPKQLTHNFLWCNWGVKLQNCILICNSFRSLIDNNPNRVLSKTVPYIYDLFPHTVELVLENNFKFTDIFNDTSLHYFPKETLSRIDETFWKKSDKPTYESAEEFITALMIEKLNI